MLHTEAANLECWSWLQLSGAELALREVTHDAEHAEGWPSQVWLHGTKLPAESWSKLQHSKSRTCVVRTTTPSKSSCGLYKL
jgi:hypothetical protein